MEEDSAAAAEKPPENPSPPPLDLSSKPEPQTAVQLMSNLSLPSHKFIVLTSRTGSRGCSGGAPDDVPGGSRLPGIPRGRPPGRKLDIFTGTISYKCANNVLLTFLYSNSNYIGFGNLTKMSTFMS